MFSLSARFRKSRTPGAEGSVYYIIRDRKTERNITGNLRGMDESIMATAKDRIAFDLMTIYCVIERLLKKNRETTLDDIVPAGTKAVSHSNPFTKRIRNYPGKYPVSDEIASVSKIFADKFMKKSISDSNRKKDRTGLIGYISALTNEYQENGKPYARSLRSSQLKLMVYLNNAEIPIASITPDFILDYKAYLSDNVAAGTVTFYLRVLRTVLIRAMREGLLSNDFVWPSDVKLTLSRSSPKPATNEVNIDTIRQLEKLNLSDDKTLELARDLFMFGFYAQGMELANIVNLRVDNLNGNILTYRKRGNGTERSVILGDKALSIIRKYHDKDRDSLFSLNRRRWPYSYTTIRTVIATSLKKIGQLLNLSSGLTFSMNIHVWKSISQSTNIAELLVS